MTGPFFETTWIRIEDHKSNESWSKFGRLTFRLVLLIVVGVLVATWLFLRPGVNTYNVSANSSYWSKDVQIALSRSGAGGSVAPVGTLSSLPGIGKISGITVWHNISRNGTEVIFWPANKPAGTALEYLIRVPPMYDVCSIHLTGPWWQTVPMNDNTMSCPRGSTPTGSP